MTHLLVEIKDSGRVVVTGCGQSFPAAKRPEPVSAWASEITCPDCLARDRSGQQRLV